MNHITECSKRHSFEWPNSAKRPIQQIGFLMTEALVLVLPKFEKLFVMKRDASLVEIEDVLSQDGRSLE